MTYSGWMSRCRWHVHTWVRSLTVWRRDRIWDRYALQRGGVFVHRFRSGVERNRLHASPRRRDEGRGRAPEMVRPPPEQDHDLEMSRMGKRARSGGLPLVVWVSMLTAIPLLGVAVLALREVRDNTENADAARAVALTVQEQSAAINVLTPLQIERIGAVGVARLLELGLDPDTVVASMGQDYLAVQRQNTPVLDQQVAAFVEVVDQHDFGDRTDLSSVVDAGVADIEMVRADLADGTVTVQQAQQAYDAMLGAADLFLTESTVVFQLAHPDVFDAQEALSDRDLSRAVIGTASLETALITDIVTGTSTLDIVELVAAQTVHDVALTRAAEQLSSTSIDDLVEDRGELELLSSIWLDSSPITAERVAIQPALYGEFAKLLAERLEYLEAVEAVTIEAGMEVVEHAVAEADRIADTNRRTVLGLLAIGLGVLIFEFAIIRSFVRPLRRLRSHVERIGAGELAVGDLPLNGPSDIRQFTGALNDMTGTLDSVDQELRGLAAGALPEARRPIPGAVGTSIRESVDRLATLTGDLRSSEERLQVEARHDQLTERLNRFGVLELLENWLRGAGPPFVVMIVDLDGFKNVNDTNGQAVGDRVLRDVADRLGATIDDGVVVARIGGDEFLIVAPDHHDEAAALALGRRLIDAIEQPFRFGGFALSISASVGARVADRTLDALVVVEHANAAVYHAKRRGRGRVEMYDADLQEAIERAAGIELALRDGIENSELVLHLQPTVSAATGAVVGAEALVRWERPGIGLLSPADFIPIAERSGLVIEIGRWVLHEACGLIAGWKRHDPECAVRLAVNISGRHLVEADLVADIDAAIAATGADPRLLELELTESHLLDDIGRVGGVLQEVRRRGVAVAVDDFGTGYSSMTYLQRLPLDAVKIDRSFVERATQEGFDSVVIESIIRLGRALDLEVVAEGVETRSQLEWLRDSGVHRLQGFFIARPMPVEQAEATMFSGQPLA